VKKGTSVKPGTLVKLIDGLPDDPMYQTQDWEDYYYLRDPTSLKISDRSWVKTGEINIVIESNYSGLVICNARGQVGWIGKNKMEVIK